MASPPEYGQAGPQAPDGQQVPGGQNQQPVPVCYRHPGRQTYVSCVRCGRPACPDCLRPAAVGHQCVECIREGNQGVRRGASPFRNPAAAGARVTWALIGINILIFIVEQIHNQLFYDWGLVSGGVASGQWYRMITTAFIPPTGWLGFVDILFNMWVLYIVGPAVERVLGPVRYLTVYLVSALGGSALFYLVVNSNVIAGGASGAIFGLFGAWFVLARKLGLDSRQVVMLIVINLGIGFAAGSYIAWQAHIGGLVAGALLTAAFAYAPRRNRLLVQIAATVAVLALLAVVVVIRNHQILGTYEFYQGRLF